VPLLFGARDLQNADLAQDMDCGGCPAQHFIGGVRVVVLVRSRTPGFAVQRINHVNLDRRI
jgi:hypothetical protein